jgi:hypothetical protein
MNASEFPAISDDTATTLIFIYCKNRCVAAKPVANDNGQAEVIYLVFR